MSSSTFNKSLALSLYQSDKQFPIDLNDAWQWLGYTNKHTCVSTLKNNFIINEDFLRGGLKSSGGRPSEVLLLSIECFKCLAMMAGTEQGKVVRKYFLECERIAKEATAKALPSVTTSKLTELKNSEAVARHDIKVMESQLADKKRELQNIQQELFTEAKAVLDTYPEIAKQVLDAKEIVERAKQANRYLSV
ncbi:MULTISPECIES: hypothetical protein [unclassified Nostoc]|uniref:hypothetical protein n=1 Tax=unclassified Nostoc TaxID=2593658 RepID=UPI002AD329BD|nr:hypothetical protein [Nostoc sp. DedQUE03]MDZ7977560.1 hypothetical protein [Nostoc sp. DedQUE03]MDZ8049332.1 hypothetical protein [Nostoc sp. DedQUE02]